MRVESYNTLDGSAQFRTPIKQSQSTETEIDLSMDLGQIQIQIHNSSSIPLPSCAHRQRML